MIDYPPELNPPLGDPTLHYWMVNGKVTALGPADNFRNLRFHIKWSPGRKE